MPALTGLSPRTEEEGSLDSSRSSGRARTLAETWHGPPDTYDHLELSNPCHLVHFVHRAWELEDIPHGNVASIEEREVVLGEQPNAPHSVVNLLAWRRSMLVLVIFQGLLYCILQTITVAKTFEHQKFFDEEGHSQTVQTFDNYLASNPEDPSFTAYTMKKVWALFFCIFAEVLSVTVWMEVLTSATQWAAIILLCQSLHEWSVHQRSRFHVLLSWLLISLVPMVLSAVPMHLFVSYDRVTPVINSYVADFAETLHLDGVQGMIVGGCDQVLRSDMNAQTANMAQTVQGVCAQLRNLPIMFAVPCGPLKACTIDLKDARGGCDVATSLASGGDGARAQDAMRVTCRHLTAMLGAEGPNGEMGSVVGLLSSPLYGLLPTVETFCTFLSSVHCIKSILPSALTLAPGLIRAALRTKALLPHAAVPGVLIITTPWVFTAGCWVTYVMLFQFLSDWKLIVGLTILALGTMSFFFVGAAYGISRPMSHSDVRDPLVLVKWLARGLYVLGFFLTIYGLIDLREKFEALKALLNLRFNWILIVSNTLFGILFLFSLTSFAGIDWMVTEISQQHTQWRAIEEEALEFADNDDDDEMQEESYRPRRSNGYAAMVTKDGRDSHEDADMHDLFSRSQKLV